MRTSVLSGLALAASFALNGFAGPAADACVQDLESLPGFLLANDAGARDSLAQFGQKYFDAALAEAKTDAAQIRGNAGCAPVINKYLRAWRHGHLGVEEIAPPAAAQPAKAAEPQPPRNPPTLENLSSRTLRLTLRSFELYNREPLIALIKAHREDMERHPYWIIDVRGNGGGGDSSFEPLTPWLLPDEFVSANDEIAVTPANMESFTRGCALAAPGDPVCKKFAEEATERMRKAGTGPAARKEGVTIAREMLQAVRGRVAGAYVMPPFERYELALEVVDGLK